MGNAMHQVVLDTDVGIDDALMLMHLAAEPSVEIVAIGSTHGNCSSVQAAINTIRVLDVLGLDQVPVAIGNESPVPNAVHSAHVHGADGLGDADLPAPSRPPTGERADAQIIRLANERPGELTLIANLAVALAQDPTVLTRYKAVWILGGISHRPPADEREMFDANIFNSPQAGDVLLGADGPIHVMPIDVTYRNVFSPEQIAAIWASPTPQAELARKILPCYFDFYQERLGNRTCCVHDPSVSVAIVAPELIQSVVQRPMIVEPVAGRYQAVGLEPGQPGFSEHRPPRTIVTAMDEIAAVQRVVDAIVEKGQHAP